MIQRVHVIAAFGDMSGFGSYTQRITDDQTQIIPFLEAYDAIVADFKKRHTYFVKHTGDGFLCLAILSHRHAAATAAFLNDLWIVSKRINQMLKRTKYPRPMGFRIRVAAGHVYCSRVDGQIDFRGYHINLASEMLEVEKKKGFLIHETAKQLMTSKIIKRAGLRLSHVTAPLMRRVPDGIYREDMSVLYSLSKK